MAAGSGPANPPDDIIFDSSGTSAEAIVGHILVDGTFLAGYTSIHWTNNAHGITDTATVVMPVAGNPDWYDALDRSDLATNPVFIELLTAVDAGKPSSVAQRVFYGVLDDLKPTYSTDAAYWTFEMSSLGKILARTKITTAITGKTTLDFVNDAAKFAGLGVNIQLRDGQAPFTIAEVFSRELVVGLHQEYIADVLIKCAETDDVDVWVDPVANVLNYAAPDVIDRVSLPRVFGRDVKALDASHSLLYNSNITVEVRAYSPKTRVATRGVKAGDGTYKTRTTVATSSPNFGTSGSTGQSTTYDSNGNVTGTSLSSSTSSGGLQVGKSGTWKETAGEHYVLPIYGYVEPSKVLALVNGYWRQISMHEYQLTLTFPVDADVFANLTITSLLQISKCQSPKLNGSYYIRSLDWSQDSGGFQVTAVAVNHALAQGGV